MLYLVGVWVGVAVWLQHAVAVEVVVGCRIATVVSAIHPYLSAGHLALSPQSLVGKVPDESTLVVGVLADQVPIFGKASAAVTHRVVVLALD